MNSEDFRFFFFCFKRDKGAFLKCCKQHDSLSFGINGENGEEEDINYNTVQEFRLGRMVAWTLVTRRKMELRGAGFENY